MTNTRNNNLIPDKDIIKNVAKAVNRSIVMLAEDIGEKKGTLYQITTGNNCMSIKIKAKLIEKYSINPDYLEKGEGDIISKKSNNSDDEWKEELFMQIALSNKKIDMLSDKISSLIIALSSKNTH
jgi:hypothetical protein